jgi:hypothetical protein
MDTGQQYENAVQQCREIFRQKLNDYGASWRIMRPPSITDQLFIKACRIRSLETNRVSLVDEGIKPEYAAIVNYGIIGLIQLASAPSMTAGDMTAPQALECYDRYAKQTRELMCAKNHDYGEAWRNMRISSYTDLILAKIRRIKQIEDHDGQTTLSEGIDANYMDIVNYALFGLIRLQTTEQ